MVICNNDDCSKRAIYGYKSKIPLKCPEHRIDKKMINVCYNLCFCGKTKPSYALNECKATHCKECKTENMNYVLNKIKCFCGKSQPKFGVDGGKATHCNSCKTPVMSNIVSKRCFCGKSQPTFGIDGKKPTHCSLCKTDIMTDIYKKLCFCGKVKPTFGFDTDILASRCKICRLDNMIDIVNKVKCFCGKTQPSFGLDDKATHCKLCKTPEMNDTRHNKCICGKAIPTFGLENEKAKCCKICRTENMIDLNNKKCFCGKSQPSFSINNISSPSHCAVCKSDEMIDNAANKCKANDSGIICTQRGNKKYKGYCTNCFSHLFPNDPLTFQIRCKTKEIAVRDYINANFEGFHHDKALWIGPCECTHRRRIDHRKLIGNTLLCIETDENQHKYYKENDEKIRYDDVMMLHGGKFIFIRFNPDKYKEDNVVKNPTISTRLTKLSEEINKQIERIEKEENTELVEIKKMYYDN